MPETRFMDIYSHLKYNGVEVYSPGQKQGECLSPYTVVKCSGTLQIPGFSSTRTLYDVMCYVPKDRYTQLEQYVAQVKAYMDQLQPMIMPMYFETPSFYDDSVKAHMISIQYRNNRKI